jgi:hypothetical protein
MTSKLIVAILFNESVLIHPTKVPLVEMQNLKDRYECFGVNIRRRIKEAIFS